jgi:hypothetical protein
MEITDIIIPVNTWCSEGVMFSHAQWEDKEVYNTWLNFINF